MSLQVVLAVGFGLLVAMLGLLSLSLRRKVSGPQAMSLLVLLGGIAALIATVVLLPRLWWLLAGVAALFYLLRVLGGGSAGRPASGTGASTVRTDGLEAHLDHATGEVDARVLTGEHAGRLLSELSLGELLELLASFAGRDADSAQILEAYLDRVHPHWREAGQAGPGGDQHRAGGRAAGGSDAMDPGRAREVLGVGPDASREDIVEAHRQLINRLHPDRGGSAYLAAEVNRARDVLLDSIG